MKIPDFVTALAALLVVFMMAIYGHAYLTGAVALADLRDVFVPVLSGLIAWILRGQIESKANA